MSNDKTIVKIKCRLQAPHLYEAHEDQYGNTKYSAILRLYDESEWKKVEAAKLAAVQNKYGTGQKAQQMAAQWNRDDRTKVLRTPDDTSEYRFMKATRRPQDGMPKLVGRDPKHNVAQSEGLFVSGAHVIALVQLWTYERAGGGFGATLLGLQWVKEGEPFAGVSIAKSEDFDDLSAEDDQDAADVFGL